MGRSYGVQLIAAVGQQETAMIVRTLQRRDVNLAIPFPAGVRSIALVHRIPLCFGGSVFVQLVLQIPLIGHR